MEGDRAGGETEGASTRASERLRSFRHVQGVGAIEPERANTSRTCPELRPLHASEQNSLGG